MVERFQTLGELEQVIYLVFQQERGSAEQRDHLQGYVQLSRRCSLAAVKRDVFMSCTVHLIVAKGSPQKNRTYCTKDEGRISGPYEFGEVQAGTGHRTDLDQAAELVRTQGAAQVARDFPAQYVRWNKGLKALEAQLQRFGASAMREVVNCAVLWGPTDLGKSHAAFTLDSPADTFVVPIQNSGALWFDGYEGQRTLIFDDFDPKTVPYRTLLRVCDRYRLELPVKGGFVVGKWRNVVFTANDPPAQWYQKEEPYEGGPLERRLGLVLPVFDRNACGLFKAAFITTFFEELVDNELKGPEGPEVDPEVAGNNVAATSGPVAESADSDTVVFNTTVAEPEDADAFVGGFDVEALDEEWFSLEAELAALEPDSEVTEPFGDSYSE